MEVPPSFSDDGGGGVDEDGVDDDGGVVNDGDGSNMKCALDTHTSGSNPRGAYALDVGRAPASRMGVH